MDSVFALSAAGMVSTYTGVVDFLEDGNQAVFDSIFGTTPTPIKLEAAKKGVPVEDTHTLQTDLRSFVSLCELFILCSIVTRRYVGTSDFDRTAIITDVEDALSKLKLEFRVRGQMQFITPDELYREYQNYIPLLPDDTQDWSFHLVVLFLNALPVSLKKLVVSRGYKLPRLSDLCTAASQQHELEVLREATVAAQLVYEEEKQRIETMVSSISSRRHPRHNSHFLSPGHAPPVPASLLHYGSGSIAEQTIVSHQPGGNQKPVVTKADGLQYPKNPENGYVSRYPTTFRGCLGCGQLGHLFKDCSKSRDQEVRADYWQELWCHIPATRKKPATTRDDRTSRSNTDAPVMHVATQQSPPGSLGRGQGVNTPSWMSKKQSSSPPKHNNVAPENNNP